jgi:hypothetical protein
MIPLAHHGCCPDQARFRQGPCGATVTKAVRPRFASRVVARGRPVEKYKSTAEIAIRARPSKRIHPVRGETAVTGARHFATALRKV